MKPVLYLNIGILLLCTLVISLFAIFSEKFICYGEYISWNSRSEKQISVVNNGGCIIDQKLFVKTFGIYNEGIWDDGNGHKLLRYVILFSLLVAIIFFGQEKHRKIVSERFGVFKVLAIYGISLSFLALLLIFSAQLDPNDQNVLIFFYGFLPAVIAAYYYAGTKLRYMMAIFFLLIVISLLFEISYFSWIPWSILELITTFFGRWGLYFLVFLFYGILFFGYFTLVYFLLMKSTSLILMNTKVLEKLGK